VLGTFKPFKSVGTDEIVPAHLQQSPIPVLHITAWLAYGYISMAWRQVRVTFMPKARKSDSTEAKAYRSISLSPFLLKTME
jgi:hypothetical protein